MKLIQRLPDEFYPQESCKDSVSKRAAKQGRKFYSLGYVHDVSVCIASRIGTVVGIECEWDARVIEPKELCYVTIYVNAGNLRAGVCSCQLGRGNQGYCKHVVALVECLYRMWYEENEYRYAHFVESSEQNEVAQNTVKYDKSGYGILAYNRDASARSEMRDILLQKATQVRKFSTEEWDLTRRFIECVTGMPDITQALKRGLYELFIENVDLKEHKSSEEYWFSTHYGLPDPRDLRHGWMTLLELAYEKLRDASGLCAVYMYYILTSTVEKDREYARRLHYLSGIHWDEYKDKMRAEYASSHLIMNAYLPAMEQFYCEAQMSEEAYALWKKHKERIQYLQTKRDSVVRAVERSFWGSEHKDELPCGHDSICVDDASEDLLTSQVNEYSSMNVLLSLVHTIALEYSHEADHEMCDILLSAESPLYRGKSRADAQHLHVWLEAYEKLAGSESTRDVASQIASMFPRRQHVQNVLEQWVSTEEDGGTADQEGKD